MKHLRNLTFLFIVISMFFSLVACTSENAVKKATGGAVDVDKKGNVTIKDKNGDEQLTVGKAKWNKEKMYGMDAPEATLDSSISSNDGTTYNFLKMKEKDAAAYIEKIKEAGFTYETYIIDDYSYTGTNKDGFTISFIYSKDTKTGSITAVKGEKPTENNGGVVIKGENAEWDSVIVGGIPNPGVKITSFASTDDGVTYTFDKLDNPKEYLEKIKENGFTLEPYEVESSGDYMYNAQNSAGDSVMFMSSIDGSSLIYTKASH